MTSHQVYPQNSKLRTFEHLGPDQGMNSYIAPCMIQDRTGYLWFGTYSGINRYDGNRFTSYKYEPGNPNSINSGTVQALCEDKDGNIWIGTSLGLDKFERTTGTFSHFFPHSPERGIDFSSYVLSICEDTSGALWVGTGDGLIRFDKSSGIFTTFRHDSTDPGSISNNYVHALLKGSNGSIWIGVGNGLDRLDSKTERFVHYWHDPNNKTGSIRIEWDNSIEYSLTYQVNSIYEDHSGLIWLCTNGEGLIEVNPRDGTNTAYRHDANDPHSLTCLTSDNIESICQDHDGAYWVGTKGNGLSKFDKQTHSFTHYYHDDYDPGSLSINMILAINCEQSGTIWITTFNGVNKINRKDLPFRQYSSFENSWDKRYGTGASVIKGSDGKLWVMMDNGEILKFDPRADAFVPQFNSFKAGRNYIAEDNLGNILIESFEGGIYEKERDGRVTRIDYPSGEEFNQRVYCICAPSSNDTAWVGTLEGGLFLIDKRTKTISPITSINTSIKCVFKDSFGLLWAGTKDAGLIQYNQSQRALIQFKSDVNDSRSISGNSISTIYEDKKNDIWVGTNIGLNKYIRSTNSFVHFTEREGLPSNLIFSMEGDSHSNIWFSTDNGIAKFNPETNQIKNYDKSYGFTSNRFYYTGCETEDGEIYFGGPGGLTRFHPDSIRDNPYVPPIVITAFRVLDRIVPFGDKIRLSYDEGFLSFEFAALSYVSPERNRYAYELQGVDKDWVYSGNSFSASYPNLAPGEYTFRVKGSNNDGIWNETGTSLSITISPPWWKTRYAYVSYSLILIFTLLAIRRYELKRVELRDQIKMNAAVLKEKEETDKMKSRFFANISHEFRTPLTLILGPAEEIIRKLSDEDIVRQAGMIKRNAKRLLQLVNQLLDLSKLEAGKSTLEATKSNIVVFVKGIAISFESLSWEKDISFLVLPEKESIEMYFDKEKMIKILSNILSNSFKFTPPGGTILVSIAEGDKSVELKVRDTGIGIPKNEISKLFDRFYQVDSSFTKEYEGTGIGLALTKELVELQHGTISVESALGLWTEVTLTFPLGRDHLKDEDILVDERDDTSSVPVQEDRYIPSDNKERDLSSEGELSSGEEKHIVLVVEDNYDMREYIKESLAKDYSVQEAMNGEEGVRKAQDMIPDMVISDLMMPKLNGIELVRVLKNDERTSHVPIIILTAKSGQESKLEGLEIGADDYLTKPFDIKELQIRVKNLIDIRRKLQEKFAKTGFNAPKGEGRKIGSVDEKFLIKVNEVVEKHLSEEDFGIEAFGKELGMGRMQIHRKLKARPGKSASRYIRSFRLERARRILEERNENISEVAYSVGFGSPAYFTRCFKEEFGHPPSDLKG
jgi:signal transduction histidine kinase/ligand-binding sensor domain-containing protein/AraC-like DNA-binding protein